MDWLYGGSEDDTMIGDGDDQAIVGHDGGIWDIFLPDSDFYPGAAYKSTNASPPDRFSR